ncbi:MAG: hypothetical protein HUU21_33870 [Polyangiaceae bacterium]|nr:hypothetical protein [Polyangiaceae bacterium]
MAEFFATGSTQAARYPSPAARRAAMATFAATGATSIVSLFRGFPSAATRRDFHRPLAL